LPGNIETYLAIEDVLDDIDKITTNFSFLEFNFTGIDRNMADNNIINPIFNIEVKDGKYKIVEPDINVHGNKSILNESELIDLMPKGCNNDINNIGLPEDWYDEFAIKIRTALKKLELI
jgi:hypothetical protein